MGKPHTALASPDLQRNPDARQAWRTRSSASGNSLSSCLCATTGTGWTGHRRSSPKRCSSWRSRRLTGCRAVSAVYSLLRRIEMGVYDRMTVLVTESYVEAGPPPFRARVGVWKGRKRISATWCNRQGAAGAAYCCFAACSSRSRYSVQAERARRQSLLKLDQARALPTRSSHWS